MEKTISVKSIVIGVLAALCLFVVVAIIPFLFLWAGLSAKITKDQIALQKIAVKTSVFKYQKIYTRNSIMPLLVLTGDYVDAIRYFNELELLDGADSLNTKLAIYSFIQTGDYDNALNYALLINDRSRIAQVYLRIHDYPKAKITVDGLMTETPIKISTYLYKSELLFIDGKYKEADDFVDKALKMSSSYVEALYLKSKILTKLGKDTEAKRYFAQAKYLETQRENLYN